MNLKREKLNWKIQNKTETSAELVFYGEVVEETPRDWWTGEKVEGNFIALEEFVEDFEQLRAMTDLTVRINSCGGEFYAGLTIHNLLKSLNAKVTVIIDGIAASAASVIACAGDEVLMYPGSVMMIHSGLGFLSGWYNLADLEDVKNSLSACQRSLIEVYKAKSGKTEEEIQEIINAETWFTGKEAVENGFATQVIEESPKDFGFKIDNKNKILIANGIKHDISTFKNIPDDLKNSEELGLLDKITDLLNKNALKSNGLDKVTNEIKGGKKDMVRNVEELKATYPDLVAEIENSIKADSVQAKEDEQNLIIENAIKAERQRIKDIEEIENSILDKELIQNAKYGETSMKASDLALEAIKKQAETSTAFLNNIDVDAEESEADKINAQPNGGADAEDVEAVKRETVNSIKKALETVAKQNGGK